MGFLRRLWSPTPSIYTKLIVALAVLVAVVAVGSAMFLVEKERVQQLGALDRRATRITDLLEQSLAQALWNVDTKAIQRQLNTLASDPELAEVTVTAVGYGTVAVAGPEKSSDARGHVVRVRPIAYAQFERFPPQKIGEVRVVLTLAKAEAAIARARRAIFAIAAAVVLMLYVVTTVLLKRILRTPMTRLEGVVDRLAAGDLDARCSGQSTDELGRLAERINVMADRLRGFTASLRESEARFRTFVDHATDALFMYDDRLTVLDVNRQACESLGYRREELIGVHPRDFDVNADEAFLAWLAGRIGAGETVTFETLHRRKDGTVFPVEIRSRQFQQGERRFRLSLVRDITERKRAEEKILQQEMELRQVLDFAPQLVAVFGSDRERLYANRPALDYFGVTLEGWRSIPDLFYFYHPDDRERVANVYTGPGSDVPHEFEGRLRRKDGAHRWFLFRDNPVRDDRGRITRWYLSATDIEERKRAEEALRQSEAYLAEAQRLSHTGSFAFDLASNRYIYVSEECSRIFEINTQEDFPTREAVSRFIHPEDWDRVNEDFEKLLGEKQDTSSEFRILLPSGTVKHVQTIRHPVLNDAGDIVQVVGTVVDITQRKQAEEALRLASIYNRSLIEASLDPLVTIDREGNICDVNAATEQVTGYTREELVGTDFSDYFTEPDRARSGYQQVFHEGFIRNYELEIRNRNGEITPVLYNASVYRDDAGNVIGVFAAARDITKQIRAEEARSKLAAIVESSDDAIISKDLNGTITSWNEGAERLYGYSAEEALSRPITILLPPDQHNEIAVLLRRIGEGIRIEHYETERVRKDGRMIPVSLTLSPIRDRQDQIIGASAIARDITAQKRAEKERLSHLRFFQNMDRINRAMQGANDLEQIMNDALDAMLSIFDSDRAYLLYPCDPDAPSFEAVMERTRPEYPGRRGVITVSPDNAKNFQLTLASSGAVTFGPEADFGARFGQKSQITIALYPKTGKPWLLGMHQCSYPRVWTPDEKKVLEEIARRMGDVLTSLLAHRDLLESRERYRVILQTAMEGFLRTDVQGRILEVNETYCRMSGFSEQELLALTIADIEAVYNAEMIAVKIRGLAERGPKRFESTHRRKDGGLFDVEISGQYQPIAGGQVVLFVRDITERKRAEKALQRSEAYLAEAQRLSHTGSWAFNVADDKYVYLSEECFRIFELDAQQGVPSREASTRYVHPKDWDKVKRAFEKSLREKVDTSIEYRIVMPDGSVKHIHAIGRPVPDEAGKVIEYVGTAMDITERKRAEEALRLAGIYNRSLIEASLDPLVTISPEGRITDVNAATEQVTGYTRSELIGTDFSNYFTDPEKARSGYLQVFSEGLVRDYELNIRHRNGKITPVLYNASLYSDEGDKVIGVFAAARDTTERKRAEEVVRRTAAYLTETQRLTHTGTFVSDNTTKPLYWSEELFRIFGFDPQYGLPTKEQPLQRVHPEDSDKFWQAWERTIQQKVDSDVEYRIVLPDRTIRHVYGVGHPVLDANGELVEIVGTTVDITERKRTEAEINSLKNYLSNIIDSMPSILVGLDNARTVTRWNRRAEAFTGIPEGEAIGKPIVHLLPDFAPAIMKMGSDMDEHHPSSMEKLLIEKEGERRFYDLMLYPLVVGAAEGAVLRIEDVTERTYIQELMVQTEKMMSIGGLAAGMAHEINNPLGIITQAAQNIDRRISLKLPANREVSEELGLNLEGIRAYFDKRQITDAIASIRLASNRAAKIVANMLQFSRRTDTTTELASLAQIVDQALELAASDYNLTKKHDFRNIEIIKDYQESPQVPIVAVEIEQVILNLLKNATQAMIENPPNTKPRIILRLCREGKYAVLEVQDNGPGMAEDIRRRVFEPFFTTKEPGVGTGLGLSVSYMIVTQNHKGLMEVQSTPGRGTIFKVKLPIGESQT